MIFQLENLSFHLQLAFNDFLHKFALQEYYEILSYVRTQGVKLKISWETVL